MTEHEIFEQALAIADPAERARFLDQACGGDQALRARIEQELNRGFYQPPGSADHATGPNWPATDPTLLESRLPLADNGLHQPTKSS